MQEQNLWTIFNITLRLSLQMNLKNDVRTVNWAINSGCVSLLKSWFTHSRSAQQALILGYTYTGMFFLTVPFLQGNRVVNLSWISFLISFFLSVLVVACV